MTPEERAQAIIDMTRQWWTDSSLVKMISDSIRAAENDALERAAVALDPMERVPFDPEEIQDRIRALKHKETT